MSLIEVLGNYVPERVQSYVPERVRRPIEAVSFNNFAHLVSINDGTKVCAEPVTIMKPRKRSRSLGTDQPGEERYATRFTSEGGGRKIVYHEVHGAFPLNGKANHTNDLFSDENRELHARMKITAEARLLELRARLPNITTHGPIAVNGILDRTRLGLLISMSGVEPFPKQS